ncbi:DNA topoisomerase IV subunit A [Mesomycoplasma conjunctivae]|uniref:DNA topoisomerase IV subunit A n=1 Tax=Mesomycoplasma conjunctivae TaxID=45361 RepID=UPI003DA6462D
MKTNLNQIINSSLDNIVAEKFIRYAKYVIQNRAIPDVRDGLKPVQRRILYSMWMLGLKKEKAYKKSARVVGDVIGKYHPHGDTSIYDALVRMSQEWKINIPLVDMHGNKGSIDDDPAAAMRYTEVRLEEISALMLELLNKNVISWAPNFDDSEKEPTVLPTIVPNLLVNGAIGIASGFATEIPPHNLSEVIDGAIAMIKNEKITNSELQSIIPGPDFPTGGIVYDNGGVSDAFSKGKGRISLVAKYEIINKNKDISIQISQIPYGIAKANLIRQIDDIRFEEKVYGIKEVIDQSDRNGILISIDLEADANVDLVVNYLLQKTDMQIYYSYNSVAICNNSPKLVSLSEMIKYYLDHLKNIKLKEIDYDLFKSQKRYEIIQGFLKVADITDEVIKVIRASDNSKIGVIKDLIAYFGFTQIQAEAIAQMRLYRLSKIDQENFLSESKELENNIELLNNLKNDSTAFKKFLIKTLKQVQNNFGQPRKTQILKKDFSIKINHEDLIKDENIYFGITQQGYYKKISLKNFSLSDLDKYAIKKDDFLILLTKLNLKDKILLVTNKANLVVLAAHQLEETSYKNIGNDLKIEVDFQQDEFIVAQINISENKNNSNIILVSKHGLAKRVSLDSLFNLRTKKLTNIFKLKEHDELIGAYLTDNLANIAIISNLNRSLKVAEIDIPIYGRNSAGVKLATLKKGEQIQLAYPMADGEKIAIIDSWASYEEISNSQITFGARGASLKNLKTKLDFAEFPKSFAKFDTNLQILYYDDTIKLYSLVDFKDAKKGKQYCYKFFNTKDLITEKSSKVKPIEESNKKIINKNIQNDNKITKEKNTKQNKIFNTQEAIERVKNKLKEVNEIDIDALLKKFEEE